MLGPAKPRRIDALIAVSLEELVPADHFYRHLEAKLDLSFVRNWTEERYAELGRPSIDPVVFFKLQPVNCRECGTQSAGPVSVPIRACGSLVSIGKAVIGATWRSCRRRCSSDHRLLKEAITPVIASSLRRSLNGGMVSSRVF
jgi:hypothetical protein